MNQKNNLVKITQTALDNGLDDERIEEIDGAMYAFNMTEDGDGLQVWEWYGHDNTPTRDFLTTFRLDDYETDDELAMAIVDEYLWK